MSDSNICELSIAIICFFPDLGHVQPLLKIADTLTKNSHHVHFYIPSECSPVMERFNFEATYLEPMDLAETKKALAKGLARGIFFNRFSSYMELNTYFFPEIIRSVGRSAEKLRERLLAQKPDIIVADGFVISEFYMKIGKELNVPVIINHADGSLAGKQRAFATAFGVNAGVPSAIQRAIEIGGPLHAKFYRIYFRLTRFQASRTALAMKREGKAAFDRAFPSAPEPSRIFGPILIGTAAIEQERLRDKINTRMGDDERVFMPLQFRFQQEIPGELRAWLDASPDLPVVYVSFGSLVQINQKFAAAVYEGLRPVRCRVLWSMPVHQQELLASLPAAENIRIESFVPQPEVLLHPAVRCFLTHGGAGGIQEAFFGGVPILCSPFFADQPYNASNIEMLGVGRRLWANQVSARTIESNVSEILNNPRYLISAKELSSFMCENSGANDIAAYVESVARRAALSSQEKKLEGVF